MLIEIINTVSIVVVKLKALTQSLSLSHSWKILHSVLSCRLI